MRQFFLLISFLICTRIYSGATTQLPLVPVVIHLKSEQSFTAFFSIKKDEDIYLRLDENGSLTDVRLPEKAIAFVELPNFTTEKVNHQLLLPLYPLLDDKSVLKLIRSLEFSSLPPARKYFFATQLMRESSVSVYKGLLKEIKASSLLEMQLFEPLSQLLLEINQQTNPLQSSVRLCYLNAAYSFKCHELKTAREWALLPDLLRKVHPKWSPLCANLIQSIREYEQDAPPPGFN